MSDLPSRMREDLTTALRDRDRVTAGVLRTALSAIANAEAVRRELSEADVRAIVAGERDERLASADDLDARGAADAAAALRAEAALLERYLD